MVSRHVRFLVTMFVIVGFACSVGFSEVNVEKGLMFSDDFEKGTAKWDFVSPERIKIVDSGHPDHGKVLSLQPGGPAVYALVKDSHDWTNIRVEADFYFPVTHHHYMGFIYNYRFDDVRSRADFGCIYVYGPFGDWPKEFLSKFLGYRERPPKDFVGNILLVNPHRDSNASRSLYSDYWVSLKGDEGVKPGEWHHFKGEVAGPICHFYIDDMITPKITFNYFEYSSGRVGFKPRFSGSECWVDNVKVTAIHRLSYQGPRLPAGIEHKPGKLITQWDIIGPFAGRIPGIEKDGYLPGKSYNYYNREYRWRPFLTDARGCVVSGMVCEYYSGKSKVYFHTEILSDNKKDTILEFSSTNNLTVWVNNAEVGKIRAQFLAWCDFWENPAHRTQKIKITLQPGKNHVLVLDNGRNYGGDGFFAYCNTDGKDQEE